MLTAQGFHLLAGACLGDLDQLRRAADDVLADSHAARNVLRRSPPIAACAETWAQHPAIRDVLGNQAFAIRGILFDKILGANWQVPWHRDRLIAVQARIDLPGWGPWTLKEGVHHVDPPAPWLHRRLAIRLHLDDCPSANGALLVIPGSHVDASTMATASPALVVEAQAGDVLVMHPLLLHASGPARVPGRRRVLHLEFACDSLPGGLRWETQEYQPPPPVSPPPA